jgi:hypothetical protein
MELFWYENIIKDKYKMDMTGRNISYTSFFENRS